MAASEVAETLPLPTSGIDHIRELPVSRRATPEGQVFLRTFSIAIRRTSHEGSSYCALCHPPLCQGITASELGDKSSQHSTGPPPHPHVHVGILLLCWAIAQTFLQTFPHSQGLFCLWGMLRLLLHQQESDFYACGSFHCLRIVNSRLVTPTYRCIVCTYISTVQGT